MPWTVPHHLPALRGHAGAQQQPVELDALVAQWVTLVHADHGGHQSGHVALRRERWPRQRILVLERLDAVAHRAPVVVQVDHDPVVLGRRREPVLRPAPRDVGTHRVQASDQREIPVAQELEPGGQREVPSPALSGHDHPRRVDTEVTGVRVQPLQARHAVVEPRRERRDLRRRRRHEAVPEVDHHDRHAAVRDQAAPRLVHAVEARHARHPAAVDVVDAGQRLRRVRADHLQLDGVAVRVRCDLDGRDLEARLRREVLVVEQGEHRGHLLAHRERLHGVRLGEHVVAARRVVLLGIRERAQEPLDARIDARVTLDVGHVITPLPDRRARLLHAPPRRASGR